MTPFISSPSVAARMLDTHDPQVAKARRHARIRAEARRQRRAQR